MAFSVSYIYSVVDKYTPALKKITQKTKQFNSRIAKTGSKLQGIGGQLGSMQGALGTLVGAMGGAKVLSTFVDFDSAMNKVSAVTLENAENLAKLRLKAKELGATTQYTAGQVAEGMTFLAMAGLKTDKILTAMEPTLTLAAAAGLDLGTAADITTNVMAQMGMGVDELTRVVDVLASSQANANLTAVELFEAMRTSAVTSKNLGLSLEGTAAALSGMANAGEKGSIAGTLFRNMLTETAGASKKQLAIYDALGIKINDFLDPITRKFRGDEGALRFLNALQEAGDRMSVPVLQAMFGERGFRATQVLIGQEKGAIESLIKTYQNASKIGAASQMTKRMMAGLPGVILTLKSAVEALSIAIMESGIAEMLINWGNKFISLLRWVSKINPALLKWSAIAAIVATVGLGVITVLGVLTAAIGSAMTAFSMALPVITAVGGAIALISAPVWGTVAAIIGLIAIVVILAKKFILMEKLPGIWTKIKDAATLALKPIEAIRKAIEKIQSMDFGAIAEKAKGMGGAAWAKMKGLVGLGDESATAGKPAAMQGMLNGRIVVSAEPGSKVKSSSMESSMPGNLGFNNMIGAY